MKRKSPIGPWMIIGVALLLVAGILILANQSFKATEQATFDEFNQRQLVLAREAAGGIELYFETLEGFPSFQRIVERMGAGDSGTAEYTYYVFQDSAGEYARDRKEEKLVAYTPIRLGDELWALGVWAPKEDVRRLIWSAYRRQRFVVGSSILIIVLGASYALAISFRTSKSLEQEVDSKTSELQESHDKLLTALEGLEAAHAFQQSIIDGVAEPIMVIGTDYRVMLMNRAAREFASGGDDASDPLYCYRLSHRRETPCDGIEHPCPLEQVRQSGQPVTVVHEHHRPSGKRRVVEVIASPQWGKDRAFQGIIESVHDITERERATEALQRSTERLRSLSARLTEVEEAERQRLARELHDRVGQNLTALGINLNIIRAQIPEEMAAVTRPRLEDSLSLVEQTTERIRDVMADLRPPVLDDYGLVAALRWYGEQFERRTDTAVAVEGEEPMPRLAAQVENASFRIVQEALTNVAKHAQAARVAVTVQADGETLRLVVVDDGIGFDPQHPFGAGENRGWGLLTMTERAESVGGRCSIESAPGRGMQVVVEVDRQSTRRSA